MLVEDYTMTDDEESSEIQKQTMRAAFERDKTAGFIREDEELVFAENSFDHTQLIKTPNSAMIIL